MSHNTWTHTVVRPMVRPLVTSAVTPNHLTALRLATAIAAATMLAMGDQTWSVAAGVVFVVSFLLDRADGELARQSGKSTPWGHQFDLVADYSSNVLVFLGIGVGLRDSPLGPSAIALGLLAGVAIVAIFWLVSHVERTGGTAAAAFPSVAGFDADDAMLIVPAAIWLGLELPLLVAAAIGAPAFLLWAGWRFRGYLALR